MKHICAEPPFLSLQKSDKRGSARRVGESKSGSGTFDGLLNGGVNGPYHIDFKKGIQLLSDPGLFNKFPKRKEKEEAKRIVKGYREEYKEYKRNGGKKSPSKWARDKGYASKPTFIFPEFSYNKVCHNYKS